ncbi:hypothetical protein SAMN04487890_102347 [Mucilaginibacter polytrichastri]|nr:hypothetical protein SAMN04487890_102347 [Mucilaginibacter polytrichastri]
MQTINTRKAIIDNAIFFIADVLHIIYASIAFIVCNKSIGVDKMSL